MKTIRITRHGVFRSGTDMVPVGTLIDVPDDFAGWPGKWVLVSEGKDKTFEVATPERTTEAQEWLDAPAAGREFGSDQDELEEARAEYEATFGEKPHARMKAETIRRKIEGPSEE